MCDISWKHSCHRGESALKPGQWSLRVRITVIIVKFCLCVYMKGKGSVFQTQLLLGLRMQFICVKIV
jgi:hypothetical protein